MLSTRAIPWLLVCNALELKQPHSADAAFLSFKSDSSDGA